ncbi:MAG: LPS assembly protein LptD [Thermoanaerobaculia bacterium]|nr:LPS assembly protein LptD [Thermoanaerobaculia bacterium]
MAAIVAQPLAAQEDPPESQPPAQETGPPDAQVPPSESPSPAADEPTSQRPAVERIEYQLPLPAERGGGSVRGSADSLEFLRDTYAVLEGSVEAQYRNQTIRAQRIEIDLETMVVTAIGGVILDEGPNRLSGESMVWDLETNTGTLSEASGYMAPDMYFRGETVERVGEDAYSISKGRFTSCPGESPLWSFGVGRARVRLEGYARARNVTMRAKKLPFLYVPYILYPAKRERTSGMMMPHFGYSENKGYSLGLAYFQTLGRSYDTTFYVDVFSEDFLGAGNEIRYAPSQGTNGEIQSYFVDDPESDSLRWRVNWQHLSQNLPRGLRAAINYTNFSDFRFFRDFDRDLVRITIRTLYSAAYLAGSWGPHSANLYVDDREVLGRGDRENLTQNQLPEFEYRLRQTQLGKLPLYLQLSSGLHYFNIERDPDLDNQYGRGYLFPTLTLPFGSLPWLNVNLSATGQYTYWTDSVDTDPMASPTDLTGESIDRFIPSYGAQIVGPSFSRVFDRPVGSFSKFKHVIEPRWSYSFADSFDDQDQVPLFDEIDRVRGIHIGTFALGHKLVAKPEEDPNNPYSSAAREIMSFEIAQSYSFDDEQPLQISVDGMEVKQSSPVFFRYRLNPSSSTSLQTSSTYSTIYDRFLQHSLSGRFFFGAPPGSGPAANNPFSQGLGRHNLGLSWGLRHDPESGDTLSNQVGLSSGFNFGRYLLQASFNFDFGPKGESDRPIVQQQRYFLQRTGKCTTWFVELREYQNANFENREVRFTVSLKNIGTFLDLGTGSGFAQNQSGFSF